MQNEFDGNKVEVRVTYNDGFSIQTILRQMAEIEEEKLSNLMGKLRKMSKEDAEFLIEMICSYIDLKYDKSGFTKKCKELLVRNSQYEEMSNYLRANQLNTKHMVYESELRGKSRDRLFWCICKYNMNKMKDLISLVRPKAEELGIVSDYPFLVDDPIIQVRGDELVAETIELTIAGDIAKRKILETLETNGILTMRDLLAYKNEINIEGLGNKTKAILSYVLSKYELKED